MAPIPISIPTRPGTPGPSAGTPGPSAGTPGPSEAVNDVALGILLIQN